METIDRRGFLRGVLGCATVAAVATTAGVTLITNAAEAAPVPADKTLPQAADAALENPLEKIQYYYRRRYPYYRRRYYPYYRRRRYWRCWWVRGRRVCGWRYW